MTKEEAQNRIKEIDEEYKKLDTERRECQLYLEQQKSDQLKKDRLHYVGKCFLNKHLSRNRYPYVKAFKILSLQNNDITCNYAVCLVVIDGCLDSVYPQYGISVMTLCLFGRSELQQCLSNPINSGMIIDNFKEISQERFDNIFNIYQKKLKTQTYTPPYVAPEEAQNH